MSPMRYARALAAGAALVALATSPAAADEADAPSAIATQSAPAVEAEAVDEPDHVSRLVTFQLNVVEVYGDGDSIGCGELELLHQLEEGGAWSDVVGPGVINPLKACSGGSVTLWNQPLAKVSRIVEASEGDSLLRYRLGAYESDGFWGGDWAYSSQLGWDLMSMPDGETSHGLFLFNAGAGLALKVQLDVTFATL